jgi:uncharacterized protein (TIGR04255 family)
VLDLPDVAPYRLTRAPLIQAAVQVRYPLVAHLSTTRGVAPVQAAVQDRLPYLNSYHTHLKLNLGSGVAEVEPATPEGWAFTDDQGHSFLITSGTATLAVDSQYQGVDSFASLLSFVLKGLVGAEGIRRCDRLGVRYLSVARAEPGEDPNGWTRWFRPEICGWAASTVSGRLDATLTRTQITGNATGPFQNLPADPQAVIGHGFVPQGTIVTGFPPISLKQPAFIMDLDFFVDSGQPFVVDALVDQFRSLHLQMDRFFRWSLTEEGAAHFGLEEL